MRTAGSVALTCDVDAGRTRLRAIRCEGLSRSSRAFAAPSGAISLMLSTLGPGVLAGDRFTFEGTLAERASLVACGQMATPVFAGAAPSQSDAGWQVADGARLVVASEPLLLEAGSAHSAAAAFEISGGGSVVAVDTFGLRGPARLSLRTCATLDGRLVYRDALEIRSNLDGAYGTVALIAADGAARAAFLERAQNVLREFEPGVWAGCGETEAAAVVRLSGARVWDVRAAALAVAGHAG